MKKLSTLFKLMPLLVTYLLLATKRIHAQESNIQRNDRRLGIMYKTTGEKINPVQAFFEGSDNRIHISRRRRLYTNTSTQNYWNGGGVEKKGKSQKSGKSKSGKSKSGKSKTDKIPTLDPWMFVRPAEPTLRPTRKPTRKPTRRPSSITPPTPPIPPERENFVEITMGGVLTATNLEPVPSSGSDQMKELARIFEQTIISSLEDFYKCTVYEIGGKPVHTGGVRSHKIRRLQSQSQVRFTTRVTKPCSECDKAGAMILGAMVFDQTFQILDASAKSGQMTTTFCTDAEGTGVVPSPCQVTITSAEGSSLDVKFIEDMEMPTLKPTIMKWDPTPSPTLQPVTTVPTAEGGTAQPTDGTAAPSTPSPNQSSTSSPVDVPTTVAPTVLLRPTSTPSLNSSSLNETTAPSIAAIPSTIAPTSTPVGALYYTGFETGKFPNDGFWTTSESAPWLIDTDRVHSGVYSIRSPDFETEELTPRDSNVTFTTSDDFPAGNLLLSILAGTQMPFDDVQYFVDDVYRGQFAGMSDFEPVSIELGPGKHNVVFTYKYNPVNLPAFPPKGDYDHIGAIYIDDVYFLPMNFTAEPTTRSMTTVPTPGSTSSGPGAPSPVAPSSSPSSNTSPTLPPMEPTYAPTDPFPTYSPSRLPSNASSGSSAPSPGGTTPPPPSPSFFDGFESGDFSGGNWTIAGEDTWVVDQTKPYEGLYSAHVKTADFPESQLYSELNLPVSLEDPGFIQFYFYAPIAQPFETFELWVDGQFLTPLTTEGGEWAQAGSILASGDHIVTWRYSKNPAGAPDEVLESLPQPDFRLGEAWLDNVKLLGSTQSFTENWDSGDFSANPWMLSGDGNWTISDMVKFEGQFSATIASSDIKGPSGTSDLSIDLITEKGGTFTCELLPSLQSPFDLFQILIDDMKVMEISEIQDEWQAQELTIQPGKRQVTFRLIKNPNNLDDVAISTIPKDPAHKGQVWLDTIVFTANS